MNEDTALELLEELNLHITTVHVDMGNDHRYALTAKAHPVITRIKTFLSDDKKCRCKTLSPRIIDSTWCDIH